MAQVVIKLGDDISTDVIYPGRYMATVLPSETPQYAFSDMTDFNSKLKSKQIPAGSVIVGGKNLGMQFMDDAIWAVMQQGLVSPHEAYMKAIDKNRFKVFLPEEEAGLANAAGAVA